jgi:nitroimidazol reductase NimA-like FMN-containing flavoprotein (pyridoxamine 5'-phosphate oxidase superfamily)
MQGTRTGKLATVRADGSPHVVPVWFVFDDDGTLVFTVDANSVKAKAAPRSSTEFAGAAPGDGAAQTSTIRT